MAGKEPIPYGYENPSPTLQFNPPSLAQSDLKVKKADFVAHEVHV